jgi:hypothetical protein
MFNAILVTLVESLAGNINHAPGKPTDSGKLKHSFCLRYRENPYRPFLSHSEKFPKLDCSAIAKISVKHRLFREHFLHRHTNCP